jgi:hypothetical protein
VKCIIAGGRDVPADYAEKLVVEALSLCGFANDITSIIHGGASGIDAAAGRVCSPWLPVEVMEAAWDLFGKAAGPFRNHAMAAKSEALIACHDGVSRGTASMIEIAKKRGLRVFVLRYGDNG